MDGFTFQMPAGESVSDISLTAGVGIRGMLRSIEIDLGYCNQRHNNGWVDGTGSPAIVSTDVFCGELSHIVFSRLLPSVRVETIWLHPSGGSTVIDFHLQPGLAFLVLASLKVMVVRSIELGNGFAADATDQPPSWAGPYSRAGSIATGSSGWVRMLVGPNTGAMITNEAQEFESLTIVNAFPM